MYFHLLFCAIALKNIAISHKIMLSGNTNSSINHFSQFFLSQFKFQILTCTLSFHYASLLKVIYKIVPKNQIAAVKNTI